MAITVTKFSDHETSVPAYVLMTLDKKNLSCVNEIYTQHAHTYKLVFCNRLMQNCIIYTTDLWNKRLDSY